MDPKLKDRLSQNITPRRHHIVDGNTVYTVWWSGYEKKRDLVCIAVDKKSAQQIAKALDAQEQ